MSAPTQVSSGIGTISGVIRVNALPVALFRGLSGAEGVYTDFSGSLNVNISGGNLSALMSGVAVSVSGDIVLVVSGGTIQVSGVVNASGSYVNIAASGVGISHFSGALNVNISGGTISANVSGNAVSVFGYTYSLISGANIFNVQSGASTLHLIAVNQWVSGAQLEIRDSLSGLVGTIIGTMALTETTLGVPATVVSFTPQSQLYDVQMKSGIVVSTSGTGLNATISYRNPP